MVHTQLQRMILADERLSCKETVPLIGANYHLQVLSLRRVSLFDQDASQDDIAKDDDVDDRVHGPSNPLGHLHTTLEVLSLDRMAFYGMQLYHLLRPVVSGNLRTLQLSHLHGTVDLQDLFFVSLTRLHLWLDGKMQTGLHEIIIRSPCLQHLELDGPVIATEDSYPLEPLVHVLGSNRPDVILDHPRSRLGEQKSQPSMSSHLRTLRALGLHWFKRQEDTGEEGNDTMFLDLLAAYGRTYNNTLHGLAHLCPLRELEIPLWVLDSGAMEAIEVYCPVLEVLNIELLAGSSGIPTQKVAQQGGVLRSLLLSCVRLRALKITGVDLILVMQGILGDVTGNLPWQTNAQLLKPLDCPELRSLALNTPRAPSMRRSAHVEEKLFMTEDGNGIGGWVMPKQAWDPSMRDKTGYLLSSMPLDDGVPDRGDMFLERFIHHISPSRKLRELRLSQLRFTRTV